MNTVLVLLTTLLQFVYIAVCRFHAGISIITLLMNARDTKNPNCICLHNVAFRICHSAWVTLGGIFENFACVRKCVCLCVGVLVFVFLCGLCETFCVLGTKLLRNLCPKLFISLTFLSLFFSSRFFLANCSAAAHRIIKFSISYPA